MNQWTRESARAFALAHLPRTFRVCHAGEACERELGHWTHGQGLISALHRFGLVAVADPTRVPHAAACRGKIGSGALRIIDGDDEMIERLRDVCDSEGIHGA